MRQPTAKSNFLFGVMVAAAVLAAGVLALFTLARPAHAGKTFTVNSAVDRWDQNTADGKCETAVANECTLRAAIQEANAVPGADKIGFTVSSVELVTQGNSEELGVTGDLDITNDVTIDGGSGGVIVGADSDFGDRIFHVVSSSATVKNLTVTSGSEIAGGGIYVASGAALDLAGSAVRNNTATTNAYPRGGGIYSEGELKVTGSTIASNTTASATGSGGYDTGAGLAVEGGTASITGSVISGNTANGAAISYGGGVHSELDSTLKLTNVTVSGNTGDQGGGIYSKGDSTLTNVTLNQNSAQFGANLFHYSPGSATLKNSIVANPQGGSNCEGTPTSQGNNLEYPGTSCGFTATGDHQNQDPLLGSLSNTGGPTRTHPLLWGSPAIDAGANTGCPSTDQRGVPRPQDGDGNGSAVCDTGAFEVDVTPPTVESVTPPEGKKARRKTNVTATFSEKMHPDTLTASTVTLKNTSTGAQEPATVTLSADGKAVTLDPSVKKLAKKTTYEARIEAGGAGDIAGNALAADKVWTFTTGRK